MLARRFSSLVLGLALAGLVPLSARTSRAADGKPPHILFMIADDLGWKDVGYHGSEIRTPNIDRVAASGVKLEQFYVMPVCSPTRASLMTGRYPMRYGLQTGVVRPWADYGLPVEERTLPQLLKQRGYYTAITGKWHLGHDPQFQPTKRGFDHQHGMYLGAIDYFDKSRMGGYDWHRNDRVLRQDGYTTNLIGDEATGIIERHDTSRPLFLYVAFNAPHAPLQAPEEYLKQYEGIANRRRRAYAAMVTCMDDAIGRIMASLEKKGMARDTLVVFSSDNGGPVGQGANNGELRAAKGTLYEGGVRVPAFAVWPGKLKAGTELREPLHMVDWHPTLLGLAGAPADPARKIDGRDAWATLSAGKKTPREEILHNVESDRGALRRGDWKLVVRAQLPQPDGAPVPTDVELFNIASDPNERTNLAAQEPARVKDLLARLNGYAREAAPAKGGPEPPGFKAPAVWGERD